MNLQLLNEYTSHNLGDAVIYETIAQLAAPRRVTTTLRDEDGRFARGVVAGGPDLQASVHVSVGGDIFNNARPRFMTRRFVHNLRALAAPDPARTFLFGQSIPHSCRGLSLQLLARVLRRLSSVTVRDADSAARLRALGVDATLSWDLAFGYRPAPGCAAAGRALFARSGIDPARAVLLSVREFDAMYPQDSARFEARMAELARLLHARGHAPAVLVQATAAGADSDHAVARRLRQAVPQLGLLDPFAVGAGHHPVDALVGALAQARSVVAVRYHTAVLRLLAGRVPYSLHYSVKGADLAQRLALPGDALDSFDPRTALVAIERSIGQAHDASDQRTHVRHGFAQALGVASGAHAFAATQREFAIR